MIVVYSADCQRLATASVDTTIKIWDSITGACLLTLEGHHDAARSVVFSADDQRIVSASNDGTVKIWDAMVGSCIQTFKCDSREGTLVVLSSNGRLAASILRNDDICIWDLEDTTSHVLGIPSHPTSRPASIVLSADSQLLAVVYETGVVNIWEIATEKCRQTLQSSGTTLYRLATFSPNGLQFASSGIKAEVKIWSIETGQCVRVLEGHGKELTSTAFSQDSLRIATAFDDRTVDIWDISTGNCLQTIINPRHWATSVAFSWNDQELALSGMVNVIWNLDIGHTSQRTETRDSMFDHIIFSKDSRRVASLSSRCAKIWNSSDSICSQTFHTWHTFVDNQMFSKNGQWLALGKEDRTIEIISLDVEKSIQILSGHNDVANEIAFAPDSRHLVTVGNNMAKVWEPMTGKCLQTIHDVVNWLAVSFSPDSQKIATATTANSPRLVKIWDVEKKECSLTLSIFEVELIINRIFFSPDCKLLGTAMLDRRLGISEVNSWDTVEGACLQSFKGIEGSVKIGAFSSDNRLLATYSNSRKREGRRSWKVYNTIKIWDMATSATLITLDARPQIDRLSFDPLTSSRIHTNLGILNLNLGSSNTLANASSQEVIHHGYGISLDGMWIVNGKKRLLWLPPDYRTRASAVFGSQVAMGTVSRKSNSILLMRFPTESHEHMYN
jgi:WD40 repeat protein